MRHDFRFALSFALALGLCGQAAAQVSSSASATTTLVDPAVIAVTADLDFGIIRTGTATVVVPPVDTTGSSGNSGASASPAVIAISGAGSQSYSISLPKESQILVRQNGKESVSVDEFVTDIPEGLLMSGTHTVRVGATLTLGENQAPGLYVSQAEIPMVVNYN